jgi:hypothetical protein
VPASLPADTRFEIEVYGTAHPATRHRRCLYDPTNARLTA